MRLYFGKRRNNDKRNYTKLYQNWFRIYKTDEINDYKFFSFKIFAQYTLLAKTKRNQLADRWTLTQKLNIFDLVFTRNFLSFSSYSRTHKKNTEKKSA